MGGFDQGWALGAGLAARNHEEKQDRTNLKMQTDLHDANGRIDNFQKNLSTPGASNEQMEEWRQGLGKAIEARTALFSDTGDAHKMAFLGRMLHQHVHGNQSADTATPNAGMSAGVMPAAEVAQPNQPFTSTPAPAIGYSPAAPGTAAVPAQTGPGMTNTIQLPAQAGQLVRPRNAGEAKAYALGAAAAYSPSAEQNPMSLWRTQLQTAEPTLTPAQLDNAVGVKFGYEARPVNWKPERGNWVEEPGTLRGEPASRLFNKATGDYAMPDGSPLTDDMQGAFIATPKPPKVSMAVAAVEARRKYGDNYTDDEFNSILAGQAKARAPQTTTTGQHPIYDNNNDLHMLTTTATSNRDFPQAGRPGTAPPAAANSPEGSRPVLRRRAGTVAGAGGTQTVASPGKTAGEVKQRVGGGPVGPIIPGMRKASAASATADKAADTAQAAYLDVQAASKDTTPVGDQGIVYAWLRGRVNRVTATEIASVNNLGSISQKFDANMNRTFTGKMSNQQRAWFVKSAKDYYETQKTVAGKYHSNGGAADTMDPDMVMATIPGVGSQPIHRSQVAAFKNKYKNATVADGN